MPNPIKYSVSAQSKALQRGNFFIGTGDDPKGNTPVSDYWNGITPPSGGYTIYLNKASQGPSIYVAANDAELISLIFCSSALFKIAIELLSFLN